MLKELFTFFDSTPAAYWTMAFMPAVALTGWVLFSLWRHADEAVDAARTPTRVPDLVFALLALTVMLAWRWPLLLAANEFSADESQQIAAAMALLRDPVFWRSVEADTAGPGDIFALLPLHLLGVPLDYFCARLTGLLLVWGMLMGVYFAMRQVWTAPVARLAMLPGVLFLAVVTENDLIYYTTEHVPVFLVGLSFFLLWRSRPSAPGEPPAIGPLLASAAIASLLPWSKLQSVPLGFALAGSALATAILVGSRPKQSKLSLALAVIVAALAPSIVQFAVLLGAGEIDTFWRSYILQNVSYVANGGSLLQTARELWSHITGWHPNLYAFLKATGIAVGAAVVVCSVRRRMPGGFFWSAVGLLAVSVVVVLSPRRGFPHYLMFLIPALTLLGGAAAGEIWRSFTSPLGKRIASVALILTGAIMPLIARMQHPAPFMIGSLLHHWQNPRSDISHEVLRFAKPGDTLAIWGWSPKLYVETGLPQAVHDGNVNKQIEKAAHRDYFQKRYLEDLKRTTPPLFVDTIGKGAFLLEDRATQAHEVYPGIHDFVRTHYTFVSELHYARIYVRNDRYREFQAEIAKRKT